MRYRIGHRYKDFAGSGVFFLNQGGGCSFGVSPANIIIEDEEEAKTLAKETNRPGTTDDWQAMEARDEFAR